LRNDDFSFKVSTDGLAVFDAFKTNGTNVPLELPQPAILPGLNAARSPPSICKATVYVRNRAGPLGSTSSVLWAGFSGCSNISV
jgi:hypothetical protein